MCKVIITITLIIILFTGCSLGLDNGSDIIGTWTRFYPNDLRSWFVKFRDDGEGQCNSGFTFEGSARKKENYYYFTWKVKKGAFYKILMIDYKDDVNFEDTGYEYYFDVYKETLYYRKAGTYETFNNKIEKNAPESMGF